jgi:hypothetical protein
MTDSTKTPTPTPASQADTENRAPALSVVVVTPDRFATIRRTVQHLRDQTIADHLEILIVHPTDDALDDTEAGELEGFAQVKRICVGQPITCVERAVGEAVDHASSDVLALIEDHAFPEPTWAQRLRAAVDQGHAAVGSAMMNGNPHSLLSWANLLIAYGAWTQPDAGKTMNALPGHNIAYRLDALRKLRGDLGVLFGRESGLHDRLLADGGTMYLDQAAAVHHLNPSTLRSTTTLRIDAGRLYGATRAERERWGIGRRLGYALGSPLIPLVRLPRVIAGLSGAVRQQVGTPRLLFALGLGLGLDAVGQMIGYTFGAGESRDRLSAFEIDRMRHLRRGDRESFA